MPRKRGRGGDPRVGGLLRRNAQSTDVSYQDYQRAHSLINPEDIALFPSISLPPRYRIPRSDIDILRLRRRVNTAERRLPYHEDSALSPPPRPTRGDGRAETSAGEAVATIITPSLTSAPPLSFIDIFSRGGDADGARRRLKELRARLGLQKGGASGEWGRERFPPSLVTFHDKLFREVWGGGDDVQQNGHAFGEAGEGQGDGERNGDGNERDDSGGEVKCLRPGTKRRRGGRGGDKNRDHYDNGMGNTGRATRSKMREKDDATSTNSSPSTSLAAGTAAADIATAAAAMLEVGSSTRRSTRRSTSTSYSDEERSGTVKRRRLTNGGAEKGGGTRKRGAARGGRERKEEDGGPATRRRGRQRQEEEDGEDEEEVRRMAKDVTTAVSRAKGVSNKRKRGGIGGEEENRDEAGEEEEEDDDEDEDDVDDDDVDDEDDSDIPQPRIRKRSFDFTKLLDREQRAKSQDVRGGRSFRGRSDRDRDSHGHSSRHLLRERGGSVAMDDEDEEEEDEEEEEGDGDYAVDHYASDEEDGTAGTGEPIY